MSAYATREAVQTPSDKNKIRVESAYQLQQEYNALLDTFSVPESEASWESFQKRLYRFEGLVRGGAYKYEPIFTNGFNYIKNHLVNSILTERTRLSGTAVELLECIAARKGPEFIPHLSTYIPPLLKLCARTNKVFIVRAQKCISTIIKYTESGNIIPLLLERSRDKSASLRSIVAQSLIYALDHIQEAELRNRLSGIEEAVRMGLSDPTMVVRQAYRHIFDKMADKYPNSAANVLAKLSPGTKKHLGPKADNVAPLAGHLRKMRVEDSPLCGKGADIAPAATRRLRQPLAEASPNVALNAKKRKEIPDKDAVKLPPAKKVAKRQPLAEASRNVAAKPTDGAKEGKENTDKADKLPTAKARRMRQPLAESAPNRVLRTTENAKKRKEIPDTQADKLPPAKKVATRQVKTNTAKTAGPTAGAKRLKEAKKPVWRG